jgi:paraquat-inducible protein B
MKKPKINPAAIGIFIAGALVILVASIIVFGSGRFFRQTRDMLLTFREPVTGLDVGSPVKLMGVTVGSVKDIYIEVGQNATNTLLVSVVIEIDRKRLQTAFGTHAVSLNDRAKFNTLVERQGLRGRLDVLSLLSGQLYIALDMYPGEQGFVLGQEGKNGLWEIPTLPSAKRELIQSALTSLNNFTKFDFKGASEELKGLLVEAKSLLDDPQLKSAITNLDLALVQINTLGTSLNTEARPLLTNAAVSLKKATDMFDQANLTLQQLRMQVQPESTVNRELVRTLDQASEALNALRQLANELERNPSSLITGKKLSPP